MRASRLLLTLGAAAAALFASAAQAQSSVTLYGVADVSMRYITNDTPSGKDQLSMTNGAISNSRWGLKGNEDLGGGLSAIFRLESGINLQNGAQSNPSSLFGRDAYVGLSSKQWGTLTAGLQTSPLFDQLGNTYDPLTVGNYNQNEWLPVSLAAGLWFNNSVKYDGHFGGLEVEGMYAFGNQAGSTGADSMYGLTASYTMAGLSVDAGYQQDADQNNNHQKIINASAAYGYGPVHLYGGWLYSNDKTGMVDTLMYETGADTGAVLASNLVTPGGSLDFGNDAGTRVDNGFYAGAQWQITTPLTLTTAAYYDRIRAGAIADGSRGDGNRLALVGLAEYALSKRTEIYGTIDYNHGQGSAATIDLAGHTQEFGVGIGFRNIF